MGATRSRRLVERFGDIAAVFKASLTELEATGIMAVSAQSIGTGASWQAAEEEVTRARVAGAEIVCLDDARYPAGLKEIYDPPVVLYVRGPVEVLSEPGIAVIGTRHPTPYGIGMAERSWPWLQWPRGGRPNTLINQGAKLVATWEDAWEELPENIRLALAPKRDESQPSGTASLFGKKAS